MPVLLLGRMTMMTMMVAMVAMMMMMMMTFRWDNQCWFCTSDVYDDDDYDNLQ